MTLRSDAIAAYAASTMTLSDAARVVMRDILAPFDVAQLVVADIIVSAEFTIVVFTDNDVHLSVRQLLVDQTFTMQLVTGSPAAWTQLVEITSLEQLGEVLPNLVPPPPPPVVTPAWAAGLAVAVGGLYIYNGATYRVVQAHTTQPGWEPPNVPALWVLA